MSKFDNKDTVLYTRFDGNIVKADIFGTTVSKEGRYSRGGVMYAITYEYEGEICHRIVGEDDLDLAEIEEGDIVEYMEYDDSKVVEILSEPDTQGRNILIEANKLEDFNGDFVYKVTKKDELILVKKS